MTATNDFDGRLGDWLEEGAQTVPDWLVERALDQAHATPQQRAGIRWPWAVHPVSRMRLALLIALVLAALLAIAVGVGSNRRPEPPTRLLVPDGGSCWSQGPPVALAIQDLTAIPDSDVSVHLPDIRPPTWSAQAKPGVFGLGDAMPGLSYGYEFERDAVYVSSAARGIVVAEVTMAQSHGSLAGVRLGDTPESFVAGLGDIAGYTVLDPKPVRFADLPAVAADVSSAGTSGWKHIDRRTTEGDRALECVVDFTLPSRVTVVNVDGLLVLVQLWAANDQGLRAWLPVADSLVASMRLSRN